MKWQCIAGLFLLIVGVLSGPQRPLISTRGQTSTTGKKQEAKNPQYFSMNTDGNIDEDADDDDEGYQYDEYEFPPVINMEFEIKGRNFSLQLDFSFPVFSDMSMYEMVNGTIVKEEEEEDESQYFAVYHHVRTKDPFLVACSNTPPDCELESPFQEGEDSWVIDKETGPKMLKKIFAKNPKSEEQHFDNLGPKKTPLLNRRRTKRFIDPEAKIIDTTVVADHTLYNFFRKDLGFRKRKSRNQVRLYVQLLVKDTDTYFLSFKEADEDCDVRVLAESVVISQSEDASPWQPTSKAVIDGVTYLDYIRALNDLQEWRIENNDELFGDHVAAISFCNFALIDSEDNTISEETSIGYAFVGSVCDGEADVSVNELISNKGAAVLAHEIGHSAGAGHDMTAECPADDLNVMTSVIKLTVENEQEAENQYRFSSCSREEIKEFIQGKECLDQSVTRSKRRRSQLLSPLSGEVYSLNMQCKFALGVGSQTCTPEKSIVEPDECYIGSGCTFMGGVCLRTPVLPGTSCGTDKYCFRGTCQDKPPPCNDRCKHPTRDRFCYGVRCCFKRWGKFTECCQKCCQTDLFVDCPSRK